MRHGTEADLTRVHCSGSAPGMRLNSCRYYKKAAVTRTLAARWAKMASCLEERKGHGVTELRSWRPGGGPDGGVLPSMWTPRRLPHTARRQGVPRRERRPIFKGRCEGLHPAAKPTAEPRRDAPSTIVSAAPTETERIRIHSCDIRAPAHHGDGSSARPADGNPAIAMVLALPRRTSPLCFPSEPPANTPARQPSRTSTRRRPSPSTRATPSRSPSSPPTSASTRT